MATIYDYFFPDDNQPGAEREKFKIILCCCRGVGLQLFVGGLKKHQQSTCEAWRQPPPAAMCPDV